MARKRKKIDDDGGLSRFLTARTNLHDAMRMLDIARDGDAETREEFGAMYMAALAEYEVAHGALGPEALSLVLARLV
jgi:hypothetical protein